MKVIVYTSGITEGAPRVEDEVDCPFNCKAFKVMKKLYNGKNGIKVDIENKWEQGEKGTYTVWRATVTLKQEVEE